MCTQMNSSLDASRGATQAELFLIADLWGAMLLRRRVAASGPGRLAFRTSDLLGPSSQRRLRARHVALRASVSQSSRFRSSQTAVGSQCERPSLLMCVEAKPRPAVTRAGGAGAPSTRR